MEPLRFEPAQYHGGFSFIPEVKWSQIGRLVFGDDALVLDRVQDHQMRRIAPLELCRTRAIARLEVTSEQVAKYKRFGVYSALWGKSSIDRASVVVYLKSGEKGYITIGKRSTASVLGVLTPWMREHGIAERAPLAAEPGAELASRLIADELLKLAQLKDSGALSPEEFVALKTKLIEDHMSNDAQLD